MNYTKLCGCKIYVDDTAIEIMELEYCPKHSACDDMYEVLLGIMDRANDPNRSILAGLNWEAIKKVLVKAVGK